MKKNQVVQNDSYWRTKIQAIRKALRMSQVEFAEAIGIKPNTLATYESKSRNTNPGADFILHLLRRYNINLEWLIMDKKDAPIFLDSDSSTIKDDAPKLSGTCLEMFLAMQENEELRKKIIFAYFDWKKEETVAEMRIEHDVMIAAGGVG